jgi:hypothetical protein
MGDNVSCSVYGALEYSIPRWKKKEPVGVYVGSAPGRRPSWSMGNLLVIARRMLMLEKFCVFLLIERTHSMQSLLFFRGMKQPWGLLF